MSMRILSAACVLGLSTVLSGCGAGPVSEHGRTGLSEAPATRDVGAGQTPKTTAHALPCSLSPDFPLTCGSYTTVNASGVMDWATNRPVTLRLEQTPESLMVSLTTPCNAISAPAATFSSQALAVDSSGLTVGAKACYASESAMEAAAIKFLRAPLSYTAQESQIVLKNSHGSLRLQHDSAAR